MKFIKLGGIVSGNHNARPENSRPIRNRASYQVPNSRSALQITIIANMRIVHIALLLPDQTKFITNFSIILFILKSNNDMIFSTFTPSCMMTDKASIVAQSKWSQTMNEEVNFSTLENSPNQNTEKPFSRNLFDYATSELSQDAFICWICAQFDSNDAAVRTASQNLSHAFLESKDNDPSKSRKFIDKKKILIYSCSCSTRGKNSLSSWKIRLVRNIMMTSSISIEPAPQVYMIERKMILESSISKLRLSMKNKTFAINAISC